MNRLESMRRLGIYNEEKKIDSILVGKIQKQYKDWKTYVKTIEHYLNYKKVNLQLELELSRIQNRIKNKNWN
jgi:hypothetical protein